MRHRTPPRLAVAFLNRFGPNDDGLVGDLIEDFEAGRSRLWFWKQAGLAAFGETLRPDREIRPLRLVEDHPPLGFIGSRVKAMPSARRMVNLTASPLAGIGGLGLATLALLITWIVPEVWWIAGASMLAGAAAGIVLVAANRRRRDPSPWMGTPTLLSRHTVDEDQAASEITADHRQ
jgi:hypothetical protein